MRVRSGLVFVCVVVVVAVCVLSGGAYGKDVTRVLERLSKLQASHSSEYAPPESLFHLKGEYASKVRMNFEGSAEQDLLRDLIGIPDSNSFVTMFVVQTLLGDVLPYATASEAAAHPLSAGSVADALATVVTYLDRNAEFEQAMVFWPQTPSKANASVYEANPPNLFGVLDAGDNVSEELLKLLKALGLEHLFPKVEQALEGMVMQLTTFGAAFRIPADFDDSALNVLLGSMLAQVADAYPEAWGLWSKANGRLSQWSALVEKYAYTPSSGRIDPRTYYFAHEYFEGDEAADAPLIPTWVLDLDDDRVLFDAGVSFPFNVNNVDATVISNNIIAITHALVYGFDSPDEWFTPFLADAYVASAKYLAWTIESGRVMERPDLGLTYYPSVADIQWFISRTVHLLASTEMDPSAVGATQVKTIGGILTSLMRGNVTAWILSDMVEDGNDKVYWNGFLGGDKHSDDRLFTTAVTTHALINSWTARGAGNGTLAWVAGTPDTVKTAVQRGAAWISANEGLGYFKTENAFFSGSVKGMDLPFFFPSNYNAFLNGTQVDPHNPASMGDLSPELVCAFDGVVSPADYNSMLSQTFYGEHVPPFPPGGFVAEGGFAFWSSESMTLVQVAAALVKSRALF